MKLVPLSDPITPGVPWRATNFLIPLTQPLVSIDDVTSKKSNASFRAYKDEFPPLSRREIDRHVESSKLFDPGVGNSRKFGFWSFSGEVKHIWSESFRFALALCNKLQLSRLKRRANFQNGDIVLGQNS